jgi:hypothetical protein
VFHLDVAKVYLDVSSDAMALHVCCVSPFQSYVASVSTGEHMLQKPRSLGDSGLPQLPATAARAPPWVTMRAPEPKDTSAMRKCRPVMRTRSCLLPPCYTGSTGAMLDKKNSANLILSSTLEAATSLVLPQICSSPCYLCPRKSTSPLSFLMPRPPPPMA